MDKRHVRGRHGLGRRLFKSARVGLLGLSKGLVDRLLEHVDERPPHEVRHVERAARPCDIGAAIRLAIAVTATVVTTVVAVVASAIDEASGSLPMAPTVLSQVRGALVKPLGESTHVYDPRHPVALVGRWPLRHDRQTAKKSPTFGMQHFHRPTASTSRRRILLTNTRCDVIPISVRNWYDHSLYIFYYGQ